VFVFLWVLAAMGVAYWAKINGRNAAIWFAIAVLLSPLVGSIALMILDRRQRR